VALGNTFGTAPVSGLPSVRVYEALLGPFDQLAAQIGVLRQSGG
jgi:hypothetical protein